MDSPTSGWKDFFLNWPDGLPPTGVVVCSFGEQIPFAGFLTSQTYLLIERKMPDSLGTRMVVIPYEQIVALKITEVVKTKVFQSVGFSDTAAKKQVSRKN